MAYDQRRTSNARVHILKASQLTGRLLCFSPRSHQNDDDFAHILLGAQAIADYIQRPYRQTVYLLETKQLPAGRSASNGTRPGRSCVPASLVKMGRIITSEQIETRSKKVRGMAKASIELIEAMAEIAEVAEPITGRRRRLQVVHLRPDPVHVHARYAEGLSPAADSRAKTGRSRGNGLSTRPANWRIPSWKDPAAFVRDVRRSYRRDFWSDQPDRVEVWSEKGTIRGVLAPDSTSTASIPGHARLRQRDLDL